LSNLAIGGSELDASWFLLLGAILFTLGAVGVLVRRNPLVILICIELMLNAVNLTLITFSRHLNNGDGQIFALTVMAVAASEVVVGLGLIVALNRKRVPLDVDRLSSLRG
jgi:NADH-quinone oxidoreductase subunit K